MQEDQRKWKIQKIELYDASHEKNDGKYVNNNVKVIIVYIFSLDYIFLSDLKLSSYGFDVFICIFQ